jgi:hypothetical protein
MMDRGCCSRLIQGRSGGYTILAVAYAVATKSLCHPDYQAAIMGGQNFWSRPPYLEIYTVPSPPEAPDARSCAIALGLSVKLLIGRPPTCYSERAPRSNPHNQSRQRLPYPTSAQGTFQLEHVEITTRPKHVASCCAFSPTPCDRTRVSVGMNQISLGQITTNHKSPLTASFGAI